MICLTGVKRNAWAKSTSLKYHNEFAMLCKVSLCYVEENHETKGTDEKSI